MRIKRIAKALTGVREGATCQMDKPCRPCIRRIFSFIWGGTIRKRPEALLLPRDIALPVQPMYLSEQTAFPVSGFAAPVAALFSKQEETESGENA